MKEVKDDARHTALPWRQDNEYIVGTSGDLLIGEMFSPSSADAASIDYPKKGESLANVCFVITACNQHYDLLADRDNLQAVNEKLLDAVNAIANSWPREGSLADAQNILEVHGINDGRNRAVKLYTAVCVARKALVDKG